MFCFPIRLLERASVEEFTRLYLNSSQSYRIFHYYKLFRK